MSDKAHIHSIDALEAFRLQLIQYLEKATSVMNEVSSEVKKTMLWLEEDRKPYWQHQVRLRQRALEEAQNEMFGAKLSQFKHSSDAQQMTLHRAKRALGEAEEKLRRVKAWSRRYPSEIEPLGREVDKFQTVLVHDLKKAVALLNRIVRTVEGYTERHTSRKTGTQVIHDDAKHQETPLQGGERKPLPDQGNELS